MARQFGIITTTTGITGIVINSLNRSASAEIAEARNEKGQITDLKAYSTGETIKVDGLLDAASASVTAGSALEISGKNYIIESVEISETNTGYATASISARAADNAAIEAYTAASAE